MLIPSALFNFIPLKLFTRIENEHGISNHTEDEILMFTIFPHGLKMSLGPTTFQYHYVNVEKLCHR